MSRGYDNMIESVDRQLEFVKVKEPTLDIKAKRYYAVCVGGQDNTYNIVTANSWNESQASFSATSVTQQIVIDRKIMLVARLRFQLTGPDQGKLLIQSGRDALRAFPLARSMNVLTVQINTSSVSINMADIMKGLQQYIDEKNFLQEYTNSPSYPDQSQQYSDLEGFMRNPLNGFGDSIYSTAEPRGAFPITINTLTNTVADFTVEIAEPLFISPLHFEKNLSQGFIGVDTLNVNVQWKSNLINSMWSRNETDALFTTAAVSFQAAPFLILRQITPSPLVIQDLPMETIYPYYQMKTYLIDQPPLNAGASFQGQTNSIQVGVVPRRIYLYVDRSINEERYDRPDAFLPIESISINFANRSGMLASANQRALYNISKKNGVNISWRGWSGATSSTIVGTVTSISGVGGVLCLNIPEDIPMFNSDLLTSGSVVQTNLQMTVNYRNVSDSTITPRIVLITQTEGAYEIMHGGQSQTFLGLVTENDVLNAPYIAGIDYSDVQELYGGNVFENIKSFIKKIPAGIRKATEFVREDILPIAEAVVKILPMLGVGIEAPQGGVVIGGRNISREELKSRYMENLRRL